MAIAGLGVPWPRVTVKATCTPATPTLSTDRTCTRTGSGKAEFCRVCWLPPLTRMIVLAVGVIVTGAVSA